MSWQRPSDSRVYILLLLMAIFWSLNFVIAKVALREFPPLLLACLRTTISGVFILPISLWRERSAWREWKWTELRGILFLSIFGVVVNQVLFTIGLAWTSVAHASIVVTLMPVMVLIFSAIARQERITGRKALGVATAAAGVVVLQLSKDTASGAFLGDVCVFLSGFALALFTVVGKKKAKRYSPLTINTLAYGGGTLALAPFTIWLSLPFHYSQTSARAWWSLVYMAVFAGVLAYLIYYYALQHIPASRVSAVSYLQPLGATVLAVLLLGDLITATLVIGGILVLTGVYVTERA